MLKEINSLLYEFLWDGKGDKIKRTQIINKYDEGGLKMVDIESFSKALKAKWVVNYLNGDTHGKWKLFFYYYLQKHGGKALFQGNLNSEDVPLLKLHNDFIEEIVQIWSHINYTADEEQDFGNSCIWYNCLIRIDHLPFFYKSWFDAGVKQAKDLMDTNGAFLTYNAFLSKYRIKTNFLSYHSVVTALRRYKETFSPHINKTGKGEEPKPSFPLTHCRVIYKMLIQKKASPPRHEARQNGLLKMLYSIPFQSTGRKPTPCLFYARKRQNLGFFNSSFFSGESQPTTFFTE